MAPGLPRGRLLVIRYEADGCEDPDEPQERTQRSEIDGPSDVEGLVRQDDGPRDAHHGDGHVSNFHDVLLQQGTPNPKVDGFNLLQANGVR